MGDRRTYGHCQACATIQGSQDTKKGGRENWVKAIQPWERHGYLDWVSLICLYRGVSDNNVGPLPHLSSPRDGYIFAANEDVYAYDF